MTQKSRVLLYCKPTHGFQGCCREGEKERKLKAFNCPTNGACHFHSQLMTRTKNISTTELQKKWQNVGEQMLSARTFAEYQLLLCDQKPSVSTRVLAYCIPGSGAGTEQHSNTRDRKGPWFCGRYVEVKEWEYFGCPLVLQYCLLSIPPLQLFILLLQL